MECNLLKIFPSFSFDNSVPSIEYTHRIRRIQFQPLEYHMQANLLKKQLKLLLFTARSLHQAKLDAMAFTAIKDAIDMYPRLSPKYQRLFQDIVHANVNPLRVLLRHCQDSATREARDRRSIVPIAASELRNGLFSKLELLCQDILAVLDQQLIPGNPDYEPKVTFMRVQADVYRYAFEFALGERRELYRIRCKYVYDEALKTAVQLPIHSLARLCLVMNRAIFLAECCQEVAEGIAFAEIELAHLTTGSVEVNEEVYQKAMALASQLNNRVFQWKNGVFKCQVPVPPT
jgi:14-3-3 protein epsilon